MKRMRTCTAASVLSVELSLNDLKLSTQSGGLAIQQTTACDTCMGTSATAKAVHECLRWRGSVEAGSTLKYGPWEGVFESWMACPFLEEPLWTSGSWDSCVQ